MLLAIICSYVQPRPLGTERFLVFFHPLRRHLLGTCPCQALRWEPRPEVAKVVFLEQRGQDWEAAAQTPRFRVRTERLLAARGSPRRLCALCTCGYRARLIFTRQDLILPFQMETPRSRGR